MQPIDTPEGALVYADWLLSQGNVQGELITVQLARQASSRTAAAQRALRLREEELLAKHGAELSGPLPEGSQLCWRGGFVREAHLALAYDTPELLLPEVLARPAFAFLERLSLRHAEPLKHLAGLKRLRTLQLDVIGEDTLDLTALPPQLESLSVSTGERFVAFGPLPQLESLVYNASRADFRASRDLFPKLRRLRTDTLVPFEALRGLELHLNTDDPGVDIHSVEPKRFVITLDYADDALVGPRQVVRTTAQASERAFVFFEGGEAEARRAVERLKQLPVDGPVTAAWRAWRIGIRPVCAIELRSKEPQPSLLRMLAADLAATLTRGVVEVAVSDSNGLGQFRGHQRIGSTVTSWVLGRTGYHDALHGFRRAVDRLLAFDPGIAALEDIFLELDGAQPLSVHGELPAEAPQLPCCSPLEAPGYSTGGDEEEDPEEEEEEDEYGDEEGWDEEFEAQPVDVKVDPALVDAEAEEDEEDDPDEPHRDAADADLEELLTQSPVDADAEEDEPAPELELGLEHDEVDLDRLRAQKVCEACGRNAVSEACCLCATEVCEDCLAVEAPATCKECRGVASQQASPGSEAMAATLAPRPSLPSGGKTRSTKLAPMASAKPTPSSQRGRGP